MANSKTKARNRPASARPVRATPTSGSGGSGTRAASSSPAPVSVQAAGQAARGNADRAGAYRAAADRDGSARDARARSRQRAAEEPDEAAARTGPPLWLRLTSLALAIAGLAVSAYETYGEFHGAHLAGCPSGQTTGVFNCGAVLDSPAAKVFGLIPVAILGVVFYVVVVALMTPWAWRIQRREVGWLRLGSMTVGMGFVMYLIYAEVYEVQKVCEYCTAVHVITFLLFCITVVCAAIWGLGNPGEAA